MIDRKLAIYLLFVAAMIQTGESDMCSSTKVDDAGRQAMLDANNAYRSKLVNGNQPDKNGVMNPTGQNMYKLHWDCDLESGAQAWSDACNWTHSTFQQRNSAGENLYAYSLSSTNSSAMFKGAADSWWSEVTTYWTIRSTNVLHWSNDESAGHWTQMAWGSTYKVGCGLSSCPGMLGWAQSSYVVCRYLDAGNYDNTAVYQPGTPCTCSTGTASICEASSGLCVINGSEQPTTTTISSTSTIKATMAPTKSSTATTTKPTTKPPTKTTTKATTKKVGK